MYMTCILPVATWGTLAHVSKTRLSTYIWVLVVDCVLYVDSGGVHASASFALSPPERGGDIG